MKKNLIMLLGISLITVASFAKTITVSNNPTSPGQYKDLQQPLMQQRPEIFYWYRVLQQTMDK